MAGPQSLQRPFESPLSKDPLLRQILQTPYGLAWLSLHPEFDPAALPKAGAEEKKLVYAQYRQEVRDPAVARRIEQILQTASVSGTALRKRDTHRLKVGEKVCFALGMAPAAPHEAPAPALMPLNLMLFDPTATGSPQRAQKVAELEGRLRVYAVPDRLVDPILQGDPKALSEFASQYMERGSGPSPPCQVRQISIFIDLSAGPGNDYGRYFRLALESKVPIVVYAIRPAAMTVMLKDYDSIQAQMGRLEQMALESGGKLHVLPASEPDAFERLLQKCEEDAIRLKSGQPTALGRDALRNLKPSRRA